MVAAAEALRVHQTTISRRILALEERLKTRLFDRIDGRFSPTSRGMIVVRRAQEMESVGQAMTVNGGPAYSELVARGYGAGLLTCVEGDAHSDLVRLSGPTPLIVRGIWLLVLPELRRNATVRKVLDWIAAVTKRDRHALFGSTPQANASTAFLQDDLAGD